MPCPKREKATLKVLKKDGNIYSLFVISDTADQIAIKHKIVAIGSIKFCHLNFFIILSLGNLSRFY